MLHLLTDNRVVRLGRECALKSEMGGVSTHKSNEVPVLGVGRGIDHEITDESGVGMRRCGKSCGDLQVFMVDVVVNSTRHAIDNCLYSFLKEVISQQSAIC